MECRCRGAVGVGVCGFWVGGAGGVGLGFHRLWVSRFVGGWFVAVGFVAGYGFLACLCVCTLLYSLQMRFFFSLSRRMREECVGGYAL